MKNLDFKKLLVFLVIVAIIVLVVLFGVKKVNESKPTEEEAKTVEELTVDYFANLTAGYSTSYNGLDVLFKSDKTTYADLSTVSVLSTAISYASEKGLDIAVNESIINSLDTSIYGNPSEYLAYKASAIREGMTKLFGSPIEDRSAADNIDFLYDYYYVKEHDIYLVKRNKVASASMSQQKIEYSFIETKKKDDKLTTTFAIAYVYNDGNTKKYSANSNGTPLVAKDVNEFPTDKIDEFDKFTITLKKADNGEYVFESIEKVK